MAIVISGVNNNDKITASDGTIDLLSGVNYAGIITAPAFESTGNITANSINVGSNIQFGNAGIITATTLVGNVTGNINHTSNLLLQIGGSEKFRVASSGQLGIGGANYGSSGQVLTSGGSGSAATWSTITGTTINNNANNRLITGSGTANTLEGESNLTYDGTNLQLQTDANNEGIKINSTLSGGSSYPVFEMDANRGVGNTLGKIISKWNGTEVASIQITSGTDGTNKDDAHMYFNTASAGTATERLRITSTGVLNVPAGIGPQLRFENQHSVTTDAAISTFDDASGTLLYLGSNLYIDSSGTETRYNTSEESTGIVLNRQGYINLKTGGTGATAVTRVQITETGKVQIGLPGATSSLAGGVEVVNIRAASNANLIVRNIGSLTSSPAGSGVGIDILNDASNTVMDLCLRGHTVIFRNRTAETLRIDDSGRIGSSHNLSGVADYNRLMLHNPASGSCWLQMTSTATGSTPNTDGLSIGLNTSNIAHFWLRENAEMHFATNNSLRWRITSSGDIYPQGNYKIGLNSNTAFRMDEVNSNKFVHRYGNSGSATNNQQEAIWYGGGITTMHDNATLSTSNYTWGLTGSRGYALIRVRNNSGQAIYAESGSITSGSDYRMKENIEEITNGIETVKKLKPSIFNIRKTFNPNDDGKKHHGFIAHEVQEAIPDIGNIVSGTKDAMEEVFYGVDEDDVIPDGKKAGDSTGTFTDKPDYQGIDYGHMTPVLAAAIKELITKVETLESKVSTLEGS